MAGAPSYAFGDSDVAEERLVLLDEVFRPSSRNFLVTEAPGRPALAVDLGCGPGETTALVTETLRPAATIGLDASEAFLAAARLRLPEATFRRSDLAADLLPPADVAYARYLLSHLAEPEALVARWRSELAPGGRLLVEENDGIRIGHPTFRRYEDTVGRLMASSGGDLYVGRRIAPLATRVTRRPVRPPAGPVARLFGLNLQVWRDNPAVAGVDLDRLAEELTALEHSTERSWLAFDLVQLTFEATTRA